MVCRHLIINICILFLGASGAYGVDFSKCHTYYQNATKKFGGITAIHLGEGLYLAYSNKQIQNDKKDTVGLSKSSPLLGLYLFKDTTLPYKFDTREVRDNTDMVAINEDSISHGKILQDQASIKDFVDMVAISLPHTNIKITTNNASFLINTLSLNTPFDMQGTYLEALGIAINGDLDITTSPPDSDFSNGDRILKINQIDINNIDDIDSAISAMLGDSRNIPI